MEGTMVDESEPEEEGLPPKPHPVRGRWIQNEPTEKVEVQPLGPSGASAAVDQRGQVAGGRGSRSASGPLDPGPRA